VTGFVEEVHGEGQVRWLRSWVHAIVQKVDGDLGRRNDSLDKK
jgi:hypothetical protein